MDLFKQLLVLGSIVCASSANAQISTGKVEEKTPEKVPEVVKERRKPTEGIDEFCWYAGAGRVYANRSLEPNDPPFGSPLGPRADETGLKTWSFQAGVRNRAHTYFSYDIGLSISRYGESYDYDDPNSDSTYSYTSRYSYYALPLQGLATFGKDFRFFIGGGIQPELIAGYRQKDDWKSVLGSTQHETIRRTEGLNQFGVAFLATCGVQWRWGDNVSIFVLPTWAWRVMNTYDDQADYIHKARSFTLKFGLTFHILPEEAAK